MQLGLNVKHETAANPAFKSRGAPRFNFSLGLRRSARENGLEILALLGGAAIWEALGWSLGLQWLPPFAKVMESLWQFVRSGAILANLRSSLWGWICGFSLSLAFGLIRVALV